MNGLQYFLNFAGVMLASLSLGCILAHILSFTQLKICSEPTDSWNIENAIYEMFLHVNRSNVKIKKKLISFKIHFEH